MTNKIAAVFPGQGSQSVGMLSELSEHYSQVKKIFNDASKALDEDLWQIVNQDFNKVLDKTIYTQPAMLAAGVAVYQVWLEKNNFSLMPILMAGHSLGEYTALVCANALNFSDAIKLVRERGRLMQEAIPEGQGAMAAIVGLDESTIRELCIDAAETQIVTPANFNAIGQTVIAGDRAAVERALQLAEAKKAKLAKIIPVSVPCHCKLLQPAAEEFSRFLMDTPFFTPKIPVISNVDVSFHQHPDDIRESLKQQLYNPVRWVETIQLMAHEQINKILEYGPGRVLTGLVKRIEPSIKTYPLYDNDSLQQALTELSEVEVSN